MNYRQQNSTNYPFDFYMVSSVDHITGATGLTPLIQICNNTSTSFATATGGFIELGGGFYRWVANSTDRSVLGEIAMIFSATGADTVPGKMTIVPWNPFDPNLALTALPSVAPGTTGGLPTVDSANGVKISVGTGTGQLNVSSGQVAASSVAGNVTGSVGSISGVTFPTRFGSMIIDVSGLTEVNVEQVLGSPAVSANTIDANIVSINGNAFGGANIPSAPAAGTISSATFAIGAITSTTFATGAVDSNAVAGNALDSIVIETGLNMRQAMSLSTAVLAGVVSGANGTTITIKGAGVATTRVVANVDTFGNRISLTLTPPA